MARGLLHHRQDTEIGKGPEPVQPSVVGLPVLAGCAQGSAQTPLANTLLSPRPVIYRPMHAAATSPVCAEP
jgi:hypothetical protein